MKEEVNIYLIRHGEAGKSWDEDPDPGLSEKGKSQAQELSKYLAEDLSRGNFNLVSSPLLRAQETAHPIRDKFNLDISIDPTFSEIPSPGIPLSERSNWLKNIFKIDHRNLEEPQAAWREGVIQRLKSIDSDTMIFCHFMVINCVTGWLKNSNELVNFYPDNCSVTKLINDSGQISLISEGKDFLTTVQ